MKYFILSFILVSLINCSNNKNNDDYIILDKILNLKNISKNDTIFLFEKGEYDMNCLKSHYIYKYDKDKLDSIVNKFEKSKKKKIKEGNIYHKYLHLSFGHINCINDSIIDKKTLFFLKNKSNDSIFWNKNSIKNTNVVVVPSPKKPFVFDPNNKVKHPLVVVSKPIYNKDKDIAIVNYRVNNQKQLIFKKNNKIWQLVDGNYHH